VARQDDADLVGAGEGLVQLLRGAAGVGEDDIDPLADQALDDAVGALHFAADLGLGKRGGGVLVFDFFIPNVCRPANLPVQCPGRTQLILESQGFRLLVATVLGRQFMGPKVDCPFLTADALVRHTVQAGQADGALIEIHAEATSEKQALGWHLDGRAVAVLGTHTHVPTADAGVLRGGTAFCCDVGMTGPYTSVLGRDLNAVIARFLDGMPRRFDVAEEDVRISGVRVDYDPALRRSTRCELVTIR
jgi:metallophosphoesterase (TIGR00282 family)